MEENSSQTSAPKKSNMMMMMYLVLGVVALVVIAGAGVLAFKSQIKNTVMPEGSSQEENLENKTGTQEGSNTLPSVTPEASKTEAQAVEVRLDSGVFSPKSVTIKKGTAVKFVNMGDERMDVASDPHPTHTGYSEFDQGKSSQAGQNEYGFTFEKVGTWGYHNHFNSSEKGTVVVTE